MKKDTRKDFNEWIDYCNSNKNSSLPKKQTVEQIVENINNKLRLLEKNGGSPLQKTGGESKTIKFPQFRITENFGKRTADQSSLRAFIQNIVGNIKGSSWQQRIKSLENILKQTCDQACAESLGTANVISSLIFLDCMASLLYEFGEPSAGYLFESLITSIIGPDVVKIDAKEGNILDIAKAKDPSQGFSLKLISAKSDVEGSYENLLQYFAAYKKGVPYLLVVKKANPQGIIESISFNSIEIFPTKEDAEAILNQTKIKKVGKVNEETKTMPTIIKQQTIDSATAGQYYIPSVTKTKTGKRRFSRSVNGILPHTKLEATLQFGDYDKLKQRSTILVSALKQDVMGAFNNLSELMDNLTLYFADAEGAAARAQLASKNANNILQILKQK